MTLMKLHKQHLAFDLSNRGKVYIRDLINDINFYDRYARKDKYHQALYGLVWFLLSSLCAWERN